MAAKPRAAELPAGLIARPCGFDDVQAILSVVHAADIAVIGHPDYTADDVAADLRWPGLELDRDTVLVLDECGAEPVAVGWAYCHDEGSGLPEADLYVHPEADPTVGSWVVSWIEGRAAEITAASGADDPHVSVGNWSTDQVRQGWLEQAGWAKVRTFYRMVADLEPGLAAPQLPAGASLRVGATDEPIRRAVHQAVAEAFRDHWEATERDYDGWWARVEANAGYDPALCWLVEIDGVPAAAQVGTTQMAEDSTGWINYVAVRRDFRGRGLAKLLLRTAFAAFAERGWKHAELAVDAESPTGALRLYESVGMREKHAIDIWRRDLGAPA
ncbi:MAG: GNAT family N-acetyltransferase [Sporichthyaceae bacterium]|nr:GNAT family N-acetyltransferase [Sporichthyaceae bacterium]